MTKTALVTGASRGIGKAIALSLADLGYDVAIAARTAGRGDPTLDHSLSIHKPDSAPLPGSLEETAEEIEQRGRQALQLRMDLLDLESVDHAVSSLLDAWGGVDVLVNNGRHLGPGLMDTVLDTPVADYAKFLQAHALSAIRITQLLIPAMVQRGGGTVLTVSSGAAYEYYPANVPGQGGTGLGYRLGKAAGHMLAGAIRVEHEADGIRAFNLDPGFVMTERNAAAVATSGYDASGAAPPAAIGAVAAWLVQSPEADALQVTNIDGQAVALERGLFPDWRRRETA
jgi:NAD(P)-dependent dehydrogenase (short-subunit alcohol dehydrogenase family)